MTPSRAMLSDLFLIKRMQNQCTESRFLEFGVSHPSRKLFQCTSRVSALCISFLLIGGHRLLEVASWSFIIRRPAASSTRYLLDSSVRSHQGKSGRRHSVVQE